MSDADIVRVYRGLLEDTILGGSTYRDPDHPDVSRGRRYADDGPRGIAAIVALDPWIGLIVADTLLRWGPNGLRDIQEAVRDVMRRPGMQEEIRRALAEHHPPQNRDIQVPDAGGAFGTQTYAAIRNLTLTASLRQALGNEMLNRYGRTHQRGAPLLPGDEQRRAWLLSFRFPGR